MVVQDFNKMNLTKYIINDKIIHNYEKKTNLLVLPHFNISQFYTQLFPLSIDSQNYNFSYTLHLSLNHTLPHAKTFYFFCLSFDCSHSIY